MNRFYAGFARANVTPMMGIGLSGYFIPRYADGILDELEVNALAVAQGDSKVLLISVDNEGIRATVLDEFRRSISEATGVPAESIFISATHTHTGPFTRDDTDQDLAKEYTVFLQRRMIDVSVAAMQDLLPAKVGYGIGQAPNVAFVRRFRMKDGSIRTNPGVDNPDIDAPIGDVDERVNVVRFDREGASSIVLVNFGNHPDVVGGCKISADWPGLLRGCVEKVLDNVQCIFFNGAQGDVNHVNVHPRGGYLNDMFMDFDDVARGYKHAQYIARVITGGVLQAFDKVEYFDVDGVGGLQKIVRVPSNMPKPEDMPLAHRYEALHQAGKDEEIPYTGMMLTTVVAEAERMIRLEHGPEAFDMRLSGIQIGKIALIGMPGEPFTGIGRALKESDAYELVMPCCLTNGNEGYFPMKEAYDEGGYEARSSAFQAGVAELFIDKGLKLLKEMRNNASKETE